MRRAAHPARAGGGRRLAALFAALALAGGAGSAQANGGSYASSGSGTYTQSLWWLDFSGYNDATASSSAGQPYTFTLPNGAGTLTTTVKRTTGTGALVVSTPPAWSGGGAIGHGAYNGISGQPILYWLGQTGTGTVALTNLVMRDPSGNARNFVLYATDGENTNSPETITYATSSTWKLFETINYYASYNGGIPTMTGTGSASVVESAPPANDNNYNAAIILSTANPSQVSAALNGNEAVLVAVSMPTITMNLSLAGRFSASDQFTAAIGYTSPAAPINATTTSGSATGASSGAVSVLGFNGITLGLSMAAGSASPLSFYTASLSCSNSGPGASRYGGTNTVLPGGSGTSFAVTPQTADAITCTWTVTPLPQAVTGTVYNDANHNANLDVGEAGTGLAGLYVALAPYSGGSCQAPTASAAVSAASGAYSLAGVAPGSYCLTLNNSSTPSNTPVLPAGWVGTDVPTGQRLLTISGMPVAAQNFGFYNGSELTLKVFADTGSGGGTANNGMPDGSEGGLAGVTINVSSGASTVASATTAASGAATLWLPAATSGALVVAPVAPSGQLATGGSAGTTGGSYARPSVSFTVASGRIYTGVAFGYVPVNSLAPSSAHTAPPGGSAVYAHSFIAGSAGQVSFAASAVASPAVAGWTQVLYQDTACSGTLTASDPQITAALAAVAGQQICVLVKQFVPAGASAGDANLLTLSASFAYSGSAAPAATVLNVTDTTTVDLPGAISLTKLTQNITQSGVYGTSGTALPGNVLQYQITIGNQGSSAVASVVVNDATPAFTTFVSAACPAPAALPANLTACTVSVQPASGGQGALQWTFTGTLAPGAQTAVTYQVQVAQ
jgi:uncharacterized repeat protein (TIGR01451 family)